jgi:hypothetical protein
MKKAMRRCGVNRNAWDLREDWEMGTSALSSIMCIEF